MDLQRVMKELESMGTAQNRKVYGRHGVSENMYGVSYANLKKLCKKIKTDHELALGLWETGNHDARVLATMVADPGQLDDSTIDSWVGELDSYPLTDAFSFAVARSPSCLKRIEQWTPSEQEWVGAAGWNLMAILANTNGDQPDSYFEPYLEQIEKRIHSAPNRVRYSMNNALIAIGIRSRPLKRLAQQAAKRISKVEVDHGETGCKTPDAVPYIDRAWQRKKQRKR